MCGRYASSRKPQDLIDEFDVQAVAQTETLAPDYNVAPTKQVYAVLEREETGHHARRELRTVRWGLVPSWAKDPSIGQRLINARMETVAEKPSFKRAFRARRCLLPADGYYEWEVTDQVSPRGTPLKQPFYIHPRDGSVMAMAGLYEIWRDPTRDEDDPRRFLWTAVVLTTEAADDLGRIHDRMPLLVTRDRWDAWLDPEHDGDTTLLTPAAPGLLEAYPVSTAVNSARNNGPDLLKRLETS